MRRSAAEIVREYGPFPGVDHVHGVTFDGEHVWFAAGDTLQAFDPASGKTAALARRRRACRHGLRRPAPVPARRGSHPQDRSADGPRARDDSGARQRRRLGARLGRGHAVGRAVSRPQDPPDRSGDRRDSPHDRVESLRHRRHVGRRRALARHVGRRRERVCAASILEPARCSRASRCRPASACPASSRTAAIASSAAAARAARCGPSAGRSEPRRNADWCGANLNQPSHPCS